MGVGSATALWLFPLTNFLLHTLVTLLHETGHAACAWLCGRPAIPKFDLTHGGGVTHSADKPMVFLLVIICGLWIWAIRTGWTTRWRWPLFAAAAMHGLILLVGIDHALIVYAGHGCELALALVFLSRAVTGRAVHHEAEGMLYAVLGFFIWLSSVTFAFEVIYDPDARERYLEGKGGILANDFTRLSEILDVGMDSLLYAHAALGIVSLIVLIVLLGWQRKQA